MLNIVNKSPLDRNSLQSCLDAATGGAILLIEDGVYAATKGNAYESKLKAAQGTYKVYALGP
ncbi:MAG TPA: sulfurtransferase complex subunit TusB, partial [Rhodocyclaceae bacterium]